MEKKEKILILEDEKEIGQLYVKFLKNHGYNPVIATDGIEGIKQIKAMQPDLILLDLGMPKMNGIEFYQFICDSQKKPRYPVLVLTGRTDLETLFKDFIVEGFIIKPFKKEQLLNEVETIFNKKYQRIADGSRKRVIIVDEDQSSAQKIMGVFSEAGYKSEIVNSGMMGIEKIAADPPDLAVVNLNLADYPGDLVVLRLQGMTKTKGVKYVLYIEKKNTLDAVVMDTISRKSGVKLMCEYADPSEILEAAKKVFQGPQE